MRRHQNGRSRSRVVRMVLIYFFSLRFTAQPRHSDILAIILRHPVTPSAFFFPTFDSVGVFFHPICTYCVPFSFPVDSFSPSFIGGSIFRVFHPDAHYEFLSSQGVLVLSMIYLFSCQSLCPGVSDARIY